MVSLKRLRKFNNRKESIKRSNSIRYQNFKETNNIVNINAVNNENINPSNTNINPSNNTTDINNKIYYVLIRAHGRIPYNKDGKTLKSKVATFTVPEDMNVIKITSAVNGSPNCSRYNYNDKKDNIKETIRDSDSELQTLETNIESNVKDKLLFIAKKIQKKLRRVEKGIFNDYKIRSIISNKKFINKTFSNYSNPNKDFSKPYQDFTIQIMFLDNNNDFQTFDMYDDDIIKNNNDNKNPVFDLKTVINYLYENIKAHNVILIDFSCSSLEDKNMVLYLNNHNLHGGKYKTNNRHKIIKTNKHTKLKLKHKLN
jgi:hypothetical protein